MQTHYHNSSAQITPSIYHNTLFRFARLLSNFLPNLEKFNKLRRRDGEGGVAFFGRGEICSSFGEIGGGGSSSSGMMRRFVSVCRHSVHSSSASRRREERLDD